MVSAKILSVGLVLGAAAAAQPAMSALDALAGQETGTVQDKTASVVTAIESALSGVAAGASQPEVEAVVTYALDQSGQTVDIQLAALTQVYASADPKSVAGLALANVIRNKRRLASGTGAVDEGLFGDTAGPSISTDGFNSNYT